MHELYRQTTDGRATAYSERELMFTFAENGVAAARLVELDLHRMKERAHCIRRGVAARRIYITVRSICSAVDADHYIQV